MTDTVSGPIKTGKNRSAGLTMNRLFSTEGVHPYDLVKWERRDVVQNNWKTGEVVFEQKGAEFPDFWSVNACTTREPSTAGCSLHIKLAPRRRLGPRQSFVRQPVITRGHFLLAVALQLQPACWRR